MDRQELAAVNLKYFDDSHLLVCLLCSTALDLKFAKHMQRAHSVTIGRELKRSIMTSYDLSSIYWDPVELVPALSFRPIQHGFACGRCNFLSKSKKVMRTHLTSHDEQEIVIESCEIQTLTNAKNSKPFRVMHPPRINPPLAINAHDHLVTADLVLDDLIAGGVAAQGLIDRGFFYPIMGWYIDAEADANLELDFNRHNSPISEQERSLFESYKAFFSQAILRVNKFDYNLRKALQYKGKPFSALQTNESVKEYSHVFAKFVIFLKRLNSFPLPEGLCHLGLTERELLANIFEIPEEQPDILIQLIYNLLSEKDLKMMDKSPVMSFIRISCKQADGSLMTTENVERLVGKMIYFCKLAFLQHISSMNNVDTVFVDSISWAFDSGKPSVFSQIIALKKLAKQDATANQQILPLIVPRNNPLEFAIEGTSFSLDILKAAIRLALAEIERIQEELFLGLHIEFSGSAYEELRNSSAGFGLRYDYSQSVSRDAALALLSHVKTSPELCSQYCDEANDYSFKHNFGMRYLTRHEQFVRLLLFLIHLTYGMPGRATELTNLTLRNGLANLRNIYYANGKVFVLIFYNKSSSLSGKSKPIARFLSVKLTNILLKDIFFIRPFAALVATSIGRPNSHKYLDFLFPMLNSELTDDGIRQIFAAEMARYSGKGISFGNYRHIVKYLSNLILLNHIDDINDDIVEGRDLQTGHSRDVSQARYGISSTEHSLIRDSCLYRFALWSEKWQQFLGIVENQDTNIQSVKPDDVFDIIQSRKKMFKVARNVEDFDEFFISKRENEKALHLLKQFYDHEAEFKNETQRISCAYSCFSQCNMLVILPTSGGKSLVFFLHAFFMKKQNTGLATLIVAPTISLKQDLCHRAESHGLNISDGLPTEGTSVDLIVLTPESCMTVSARRYLADLAFQGRLGRIFVDECHQFSLDTDFRPMYRELVTLRFLCVPIVLLTATCPKYIEADLVKNFFDSPLNLKIFRSSTVRINISMFFEDLGCTSFVESLMSRAHNICEEMLVDRSSRIIIFCPNRTMVEEISTRLNSLGIESTFYHSGMESSLKATSSNNWRTGRAKVMVATSAFGVGIDYGHVRAVILAQLPLSIEEMQQEIGRAGRDGTLSKVFVFYDLLFESRKSFDENHSAVLKFARRTDVCRLKQLSKYFDDRETECSNFPDVSCDFCAQVSIFRRSGFEFRQPAVQRTSTSHRIIFVELKDLLNRLRKYCPAHLSHRKINIEHNVFQCDLLKEKCFACWDHKHTSRNCTARRVINFANLTFHICGQCYLPSNESVGASFHFDEGQCRFKDWIKNFAIALSLDLPQHRHAEIYEIDDGLPSLYLKFISKFRNYAS